MSWSLKFFLFNKIYSTGQKSSHAFYFTLFSSRGSVVRFHSSTKNWTVDFALQLAIANIHESKRKRSLSSRALFRRWLTKILTVIVHAKIYFSTMMICSEIKRRTKIKGNSWHEKKIFTFDVTFWTDYISAKARRNTALSIPCCLYIYFMKTTMFLNIILNYSNILSIERRDENQKKAEINILFSYIGNNSTVRTVQLKFLTTD